MSTVLSERQTSLLEMSTEGERKWKNPNQVVRIRRKVRAGVYDSTSLACAYVNSFCAALQKILTKGDREAQPGEKRKRSAVKEASEWREGYNTSFEESVRKRSCLSHTAKSEFSETPCHLRQPTVYV